MSSYRWIVLLALVATLCLELPISAEISDTKQGKLIYTLKNQEAPLAERKTAVQELAANPTDESRLIFIEILEDQNQSRIIHQHIASAIIAQNDADFFNILKKKLVEKKTGSYLREVSLSILWRHNSESILPMILALVQDPFETLSFRSIVIRYLIPVAGKPEVKEVLSNMIKDSNELLAIKKLASNVLAKSGDRNAFLNIYQDIAFDRTRTVKEREEALRKFEAEGPAILEERLFKILDDKNETTEMKRIAFEKLSTDQNRARTILPQLKRLERMGPLVGIDDALREDLRRWIEKTEEEIRVSSGQEGQEPPDPMTGQPL